MDNIKVETVQSMPGREFYGGLYHPPHALPTPHSQHYLKLEYGLENPLESLGLTELSRVVGRARRPIAPEDKRFKCTYCDSWFKRNDHLRRHVKTLHSDSPTVHYCPTCDKTFKRRDHMMRHMDVKHTPDARRFRCANCHEDFARLEGLVAHEQAQHGAPAAPRQPCPHCDSTFKRRDHMLRHVNSKHLNQGEPQTCSHCKATFRRKDHLSRHVKSRHLNQVVNCPLCPSIYKRRDHLVRHLREKHKTGPSLHQLSPAPSAVPTSSVDSFVRANVGPSLHQPVACS